MLERDYFMRQVQQLAQFLQKVLVLKQSGQVEEAQHRIQQAFGKLSDTERENLRELSLEETLRFCHSDEAFRPELATSVADLLKEEGNLLAEQSDEREAQKSYARALLLYRKAMKGKGAVPWNVAGILGELEENVSGHPEAEEIERVLRDY